ncbi:hypothetical protein B0O99DRAFT_34018 [Bisporella sp. PMI_857]|nr:hypothetical protein B0O99DRAFT_34018 [Bisporella sp. PMI_857]
MSAQQKKSETHKNEMALRTILGEFPSYAASVFIVQRYLWLRERHIRSGIPYRSVCVMLCNYHRSTAFLVQESDT